MKKFLLVVILSSMSCIVLACGSNQQSTSNGNVPTEKEKQEAEIRDESETNPWTNDGVPMQMEGYVFKKETDKILVVNPEPREVADGKMMNDAVWFSNDPETVEIGDRVHVTYEFVLESYPGQSEAIEITVQDNKKPEGADLTESEALRKTLKKNASKITQSRILSKLEYEKTSDTWNIEVIDMMDDLTVDISVEDK
ncbi:MAG: DUF3221 domain-containing protein [Bacillota bacterium]